MSREAFAAAIAVAVALAALAFLMWQALAVVGTTGPNCPAPADPQWIGWCSEAPLEP